MNHKLNNPNPLSKIEKELNQFLLLIDKKESNKQNLTIIKEDTIGFDLKKNKLLEIYKKIKK